MTEKGNLYLKNASVIELYDATQLYETTMQETLYSHYKIAFKISKSNYFRGEAADSFKNYITNGTINILSGMMDVASDMTMIIQLLAEAFYQYEMNHEGQVEEGVLDYINDTIGAKETVFDNAKEELTAVLQQASKYITVQGLSLFSVNEGYTKVRDTVKKVREDLYEVDDAALESANELMTRITELKTLIEKVKSYCYNEDGKIQADNLSNIQEQDWYHVSGNAKLCLLLQEDPFEYAAGEVTLTEEQWATGLCSDVYIYYGYYYRIQSYEKGIEDGTAFARGKAALLRTNGYAQFTDYLHGELSEKYLNVEGEAKAGWSKKYVGFKVEGEIDAAKVEGSIVLGTDELNAFVAGEAKVLSADGKAAFELEEDGQFAVGVDVSATAASAEVKAGTTILSYKDEGTATGKEKTLLGFNVGAEATVGVGVAIWAESQTAIKLDNMNINATTIKIKAKKLLGVELELTIPTIYYKYSW